MTYRIYASLTLVFAAALIVCAIAGVSLIWLISAGVLFLVMLLLTYRSVAKPLDAVRNGIYLIKAQDFSSRLRLTGQHDADRVIALFNGMMDAMKAERLKNEEQNLFLAKLLDVSPMGIAICDFDGNVIEQNPAFRQMITPFLMQAISGLQLGQTETFRIDASQIYRCSRLWFMDSGFRRPFIVVERLTEEIAVAERNIFRTIVRTIGHEVNNTMGSVVSVLETMEDIHRGDTSVAEAVSSSRGSCMDLVAFVKGYSDIVKLPDPVMTPTDLAAEIGRMMPMFKAMAGKGIEVSLECDGADMVMADMMLISRVLTNIVKNSVESIADSAGGRINLRVSGRTLTVTDNGKGISDDEAMKIFTPFYSTKHSDRGLGLMLVAEILRAHHASFSLATDPLTSLTVFSITFQH